MKKVLLIGMGTNRGGVEVFMFNTFLHLEGENFHFEFINTMNEPIAFSDIISKKGGIIRHVSMNNKWLTHLYRYILAYNFFKKHHDYDVVHINAMSVNLIFWLKAAKAVGIRKLIIHSHIDYIHYDSKLRYYFGNLLSTYNHHYLNKNTNIIELAASISAGDWMFHNNRFQVINNGVNTNNFLFSENNRYNLRKKLNINIKDKVIITVARIAYQKNYPRIINIFKLINIKRHNTKLVIVGDGPDNKEIYSLVKKMGLINNVIFLGMVTNVNEILSIADLMLMPSLYEAFPFSLIESQSVGVPALVSLEAIPKSSNITNTLKYISLKEKDDVWANIAIEMLNKPNSAKMKMKMNDIVSQSKYSMDKAISQIKSVYLK